MPIEQPEAEAQMAAQDAEAQAGAQESIGAAIPPAQEPLASDKLNALGQMVQSVIEKLSGGQVGDIEVAEVAQDADAIPQDIFGPVAAIAAFAAETGVDDFDPTELVLNNAGLDELITRISAMGENPDVLKAAKAPASTPDEPPAPAPEEEQDLDRFV